MVFSGIVESMGTVVSLERRDDLVLWDGSVSSGVVLTVADALAVQGAELGCSIAVNGTRDSHSSIAATTSRNWYV